MKVSCGTVSHIPAPRSFFPSTLLSAVAFYRYPIVTTKYVHSSLLQSFSYQVFAPHNTPSDHVILEASPSRLGATSGCTVEERNIKGGEKVTLYVGIKYFPTGEAITYLATK